MKKILAIFLLAFLVNNSFAQNIEEDLFDLSLDELMNIEVAVASRKAINQREAPGVLTIITSDEIKKSGARDLIDVFRMVPGFNFNFDVEGTVGISIRGNWANEGKVLVMVDGQEINESLYSTVVFGGRFPIDQISRIEVIRGPGSSIYGGYAELGVINVITKAGADLQGLELSSMFSLMNDVPGSYFVNLNFGQSIGDFEYSVLGHYGISNHSYKETFEDFYGGNVLIHGENAFNESQWLNVGLKYKKFSGRFLYDGYNVTASTLFDDVTPEPYNVSFKGLFGEIKYRWDINDKMSLTPQFNFKQQTPWFSEDEQGDAMDFLVNKHTIGLHYYADMLDNLNLIAGVEYYEETATDRLESEILLDGQDKISFSNISLYLQGFYRQKYFNIIAGGRFENHEEYGSAFAPRIGFTKSFNKFHYKALYSHAFRSPGIMNISLEPEIAPETTIVYELEAGYRLTSKAMISLNLFDVTIRNPIIYFYDDTADTEGYFNGTKTGTTGAEINFRYQYNQNNIQAGYSYYFAGGKNEVEDYEVEINHNALVGIPQHKITLNSSFMIIKSLFFNTQFVFLGERYVYNEVNTDGDAVINLISPDILINANVIYRNAFIKGLDLSLGVFDLLNSKPKYYQAYNGYHAPYPGKHRELFLKLMYYIPYGN
ncbi:MAG: TonB-dependent receptor plug domain-containing protein [Bacteroidetes bacterium]|nr:TonB-dependent receptor plug domain-containing protein [Bacteroidota bacterium]